MRDVAFPARRSVRAEFGYGTDFYVIELFTDRKLKRKDVMFLGSKRFDSELKNHYLVHGNLDDLSSILDLSGVNQIISNYLSNTPKFIEATQQFKVPKIMAVANATDDSFYPGSRIADHNYLLDNLLDAKPDIIDIGGESTRPGSLGISVEEEIKRVEPVLDYVVSTGDVPVSLDTKHPEVLLHFADKIQYVNDIGGFRDQRMVDIASDYSLKCISMHMRGTPSNMQSLTDYVDLVPEVLSFLVESAERLSLAGIGKEDIIIDPGIGFSKDFKGNLELLSEISSFNVGYRTLVGASRKSFIGKITGEDTGGRLPGTLAVTAFLAQKGVDIIRVHDPKENIQLIEVLRAVTDGKY